MSRRLDGRVVTDAGVISGTITFSDVIEAIEPDAHASGDRLIVPGFIDLHVHGGGGCDVMEGEDAVREMARFHARHGTTSLLATTVTAEPPDLLQAFEAIGHVAGSDDGRAARVLGAHLEGPFISPRALGAQPPFTRDPDLDLLETLASRASVKVATYAPEIDVDGALLEWFKQRSVRAQIGHTTCSYDQARTALDHGASGFTHLFNAMSGFHHRAPGAAGAALAHVDYGEVIADGVHVEEGALRAALRAVPRLYCVTDAVAAAGMPPGRYRLGTNEIFKDGNRVHLADGSLAGSLLTMDAAFNVMARLGTLEDASRRCSTWPARYLGLCDRGALKTGLRADLVLFDGELRLQQVFIGGSAVH